MPHQVRHDRQAANYPEIWQHLQKKPCVPPLSPRSGFGFSSYWMPHQVGHDRQAETAGRRQITLRSGNSYKKSPVFLRVLRVRVLVSQVTGCRIKCGMTDGRKPLATGELPGVWQTLANGFAFLRFLLRFSVFRFWFFSLALDSWI